MKAKIALLFCIVACQKDAGPSPEPAPNAKPVTKIDRNVTVISTGAEPRRELRYHPASGTAVPLAFTINLEMHAGPVQGALPSFVMGGKLSVIDADPAGLMRVRMTIDNVDVIDRAGAAFPAAQVRGEMKGLEGLAIDASMSATGEVSNTSVDATKISPAAKAQVDQLSENLQDLAVQLPAEAVGAGAQWDIVKHVDRNGIQLTTTAHVTLDRVDGDRLAFKVDGKIAAPDQTLVQNGVAVQMKEIRGNVTGNGSIDLVSFATSAKMASTFHSAVMAAGQTMTTDMAVEMLTNPTK